MPRRNNKVKEICKQCLKSITSANRARHLTTCKGLTTARALELSSTNEIACSECLRLVKIHLFTRHCSLYGHCSAIMLPSHLADIEPMTSTRTQLEPPVPEHPLNTYKGVPTNVKYFSTYGSDIMYLLTLNRLGQDRALFLLEHLLQPAQHAFVTRTSLDDQAKEAFPLLVDCGVIHYKTIAARDHQEVDRIMALYLIAHAKSTLIDDSVLTDEELSIYNRLLKHAKETSLGRDPCEHCSDYVTLSNKARHNHLKHPTNSKRATTECIYCGEHITKAHIARHRQVCKDDPSELRVDIYNLSPFLDNTKRKILPQLTRYYERGKPSITKNFFDLRTYKSQQTATPLHLTGEQGVGKTKALQAMLARFNISPTDRSKVTWVTRDQWLDATTRKNITSSAKQDKCLYIFDNIEGWSARVTTFYEFAKGHPFTIFVTSTNANLSDKHRQLKKKYTTITIPRLSSDRETDMLHKAFYKRYSKDLISKVLHRSHTVLNTAANLAMLQPNVANANQGTASNIGATTRSTLYRYESDAAIDAIENSQDPRRLSMLDNTNRFLAPLIYTTALLARPLQGVDDVDSLNELTAAITDLDVLENTLPKKDTTELASNEIYKTKEYDTTEFEVTNFDAGDSFASVSCIQRLARETDEHRDITRVRRGDVLRAAYKPVQNKMTTGQDLVTHTYSADYALLDNTKLEPLKPNEWTDCSTQALDKRVLGIDPQAFARSLKSTQEQQTLATHIYTPPRWPTSVHSEKKDTREYGPSGIGQVFDLEFLNEQQHTCLEQINYNTSYKGAGPYKYTTAQQQAFLDKHLTQESTAIATTRKYLELTIPDEFSELLTEQVLLGYAQQVIGQLLDCGIIQEETMTSETLSAFNSSLAFFLTSYVKQLLLDPHKLSDLELATYNRFITHILNTEQGLVPCKECPYYIDKKKSKTHKHHLDTNIYYKESSTRWVLPLLRLYHRECSSTVRPLGSYVLFPTKRRYTLHLTGLHTQDKSKAIKQAILDNDCALDDATVRWVTRSEWEDESARRVIQQQAELDQRKLYVFNEINDWQVLASTFYEFATGHPFAVLITTSNDPYTLLPDHCHNKYYTISID
jgi:hypothetical protein